MRAFQTKTIDTTAALNTLLEALDKVEASEPVWEAYELVGEYILELECARDELEYELQRVDNLLWEATR